MKIKNASMLDVLAFATNRDTCVVLPTLDHAVFWWPRISDMLDAYQPGLVNKSKTARFLQGTNTILRLWVPYEREPTQPMDFEANFKYRCDYLDLYGLYGKEVIL